MFMIIVVDSGWDEKIVFKNERQAVLNCSTKYRLGKSARVSGTIPDVSRLVWNLPGTLDKIQSLGIFEYSRQ